MDYIKYGGYEGCERAVVLMGEYLESKDIREEVQIVKISCSQELTHSSILGSLLGLGLERKKIGDIIIDENTAYVVLKKTITNFIIHNLEKVGRNRVKLEVFEEEIPIKEDSTMDKKVTVSSMRIDVLLSSVLHISRGKANTLLQKEYVKVNHELIKSKNKILSKGDMISVRKHGRFYITEVLGKTRKDKFILLIKKIV